MPAQLFRIRPWHAHGSPADFRVRSARGRDKEIQQRNIGVDPAKVGIHKNKITVFSTACLHLLIEIGSYFRPQHIATRVAGNIDRNIGQLRVLVKKRRIVLPPSQQTRHVIDTDRGQTAGEIDLGWMMHKRLFIPNHDVVPQLPQYRKHLAAACGHAF